LPEGSDFLKKSYWFKTALHFNMFNFTTFRSARCGKRSDIRIWLLSAYSVILSVYALPWCQCSGTLSLYIIPYVNLCFTKLVCIALLPHNKILMKLMYMLWENWSVNNLPLLWPIQMPEWLW
jgi:hypothetical protein